MLQATGAGLAAGLSPAFNVTANQLAVTSQPASHVRVSDSFGLTVSATDSAGNVDTSFAGNVTVALVDYTGTGATLRGTLSAAASAGVATFSGLTVNQAGDYELYVTSGNVGSTTTDLINILTNSDHPWRNVRLPCDVDNDGYVKPLDVLVTIWDINANHTRQLPVPPPSGDGPPSYLDVNGDDAVTPQDVLAIIAYLNAAATPHVAEAEDDSGVLPTAPATGLVLASPVAGTSGEATLAMSPLVLQLVSPTSTAVPFLPQSNSGDGQPSGATRAVQPFAVSSARTAAYRPASSALSALQWEQLLDPLAEDTLSTIALDVAAARGPQREV